MIGGVGLNKVFEGTHQDAYLNFLTNSTFQILTDSSISGITLIATLNDGVESPYVSLDVDEATFMTSIRRLLLKIMPSHANDKISSGEGAVLRNMANDAYKGKVEINSYSNIETECNIQKDIYRKTILSEKLPLVPVCPAVVYLENPVSNSDAFKTIISGKMVPRTGRTIAQEEEELMQYLNVASQSGDPTATFSIIAMELLNGYKDIYKVIKETFGDIDNLPYESHLIRMTDIEILRMHMIGYFHGDLHLGNIMFNTEKDYCPPDKGKAIIIDFGRTTNNKAEIPEKCKKASVNPMATSECLSAEKIHNDGVAPVTELKILLGKLKEISENNNKKLSKVSDKLLYPGKNLVESLKEYVEKRVYNMGGGIDVNYIRETLYGMVMQNDTPETFDIINYLRRMMTTPIPAIENVVDVSSRIPVSVATGGKRTRKSKRKSRSSKRKSNRKSKRKSRL